MASLPEEDGCHVCSPPGPETKSPQDTAAPAFFELGLRSNFSFLEGASHPEELVTAASRLGIGGIGLADRNTVAGVVRLHAVAKKERYGFRPGARLSFADETPDLLAYPMNRAGWGRLCRLLSAGNIRSTKGTCTLFEQDLLDWNADLLFAAFAPSAETAAIDAFRIRLERLTPHLGQRLHIAIGPRYDGTDRLFFAELARLSDRLGLPLLATNDAVYHRADRRPLADVLTSIREHVPIAEAGFRLTANAERHLKAPKEMAACCATTRRRSRPRSASGTASTFPSTRSATSIPTRRSTANPLPWRCADWRTRVHAAAFRTACRKRWQNSWRTN